MKQWLEDAIFYQIYPQSFKDTNSDGIGDINGIIEKLDYIKSVGFNAIWMNPCYESPFRDAGYDVTDYYTVAPRYGTNEDLKRLFEEVHKRSMHILMDLVPGHTSLECDWFVQSQRADKNEYTDRYIWADSIWKDIVNVSGISGCSSETQSLKTSEIKAFRAQKKDPNFLSKLASLFGCLIRIRTRTK